MTARQLVYLRTGASVILTVLTALLMIYPNEKWSPIIATLIAMGSAIGIHVIPSINNGGNTMSLSGPELMGMVPPANPTSVEASTTQPTPETTSTMPAEAPVGPFQASGAELMGLVPAADATPSATPVQPVQASVAELLTNVIAGLQKIIEMVS